MIDYEAATEELTDWLGQREGVVDPAEAARAVIEAALGDTVLWEDAPDCKPSFDGNHVWTFDSDCAECGMEVRPVVQFWPETTKENP